MRETKLIEIIDNMCVCACVLNRICNNITVTIKIIATVVINVIHSRSLVLYAQQTRTYLTLTVHNIK